MQNAKDSFYIALRNRLHVLNPMRNVTVRAVSRPGILVEDAEAPMADLANDVFILRWTSFQTTGSLPNPMSSMGCEIVYATSGTQAISGLDRGRALVEMDRELALIMQPMCTQKADYTKTPANTLQTQVFWTAPIFGIPLVHRNQISRTTSLLVFSFQEPGEL